ncbi:hypothetical protein BO70DRAFT_361373 [Aspergillus heteromorphus CBS 117.55]|uniref:GPI-anchored cell surface glycoprotein n=1 Tax=Aspergillus heteromorphus CBS 117.55 TaxID=1448321 RepID=A0A317WH15_9EURO|nr:uncharacterized protein BO70DRAFT_361373 [Aspergillus heteromorphus CBS 117.55]PWY84981.1 hypothetical protein BO70DRAFT_361373 [Aspergillus heteromorphus CBS 117.55]
MSLNGLDHATVLEAYQTALTEAGGWFLLRYVSRDEVDLLERGTGGVPDVRNAIDGYEETSPLYGFLQYRRRKVVLSYLPEGMSRLVQARTTVHFQSVLDKFSPHDTVFSVKEPSDLTESALSSACLLHTATGSITTSSSNSLRRRRLKEIAEDAEENTVGKDEAQTPAPTPANVMHQRSFSQLSDATVVPPSPSVSSVHPSPIIETRGSEAGSIRERSPSVATLERLPSNRTLREDSAPSEPRKSSQSARPSIRDLERAAGITPKVKLGPRPSVDGSGRPRTAGNLSRSAEQRPVASLPAGVRSSSLRKANPSPSRPRSQGHGTPVVSKVPAVPPLLVPPLSMAISRPKLSPGAKSLSALSSSTTSNEKERLMKALQMRKTQMAKARERKAPSIGSVSDGTENKENIGRLPAKMRPDGGDETVPPAKEPKEPLSAKPDQGAHPSPISTQPDPVGSDSPDTPPSPALAAAAQPDRSPTRSEPETQPGDRDLAASDYGGTTGGPCSPSAIDVPLENTSGKAPGEEIVGPSPPSDLNPLVPGEQEVLTTAADQVPLRHESPPHRSRPTAPPPSSIPEPPTEPQHDLTPESHVERSNTRKEKRKLYLEPIQVPTPDYSDDDNLLSDDSFMEELTSATVEEAKPISVGISPLSPGYSNSGNGKVSPDAWKNSRAVSNPSALSHLTEPSTMPTVAVRSVSTPPVDADANAPLVAKKINVSSGISQRIKALEKFSGPAPQSLAAPSFDSIRKGYSATPRPLSFHPESFSRAPSLRRPSSQAGPPGLTRTASSVSVTARIVRERAGSTVEPDLAALNLQPSQITVQQETTQVPVTPEPEASPEESATPAKTEQPSEPEPSEPEQPETRPSSSKEATSPVKSIDVPSSPEDKGSRTSRLLRRMSSITSRKSAVSPVVSEVAPSTSPERTTEMPQAIDIGEVNVQFPDTLLWKRRFVRIDDKGYLVLTPGNVDSSNRNIVKRYHLSEFRTPCLPDEDRQELPNSILLDFLDGNTLQCACESRQGQTFVLQSESPS